MGFPEEFLQWPLMAALLLVIGWLLYVQREERRRYEDRMGRLLDSAEQDRAAHLDAWNTLVRDQVGSQHEVVAALAKLCLEVDRLSAAMKREHEEIVRVCRRGESDREG